MISTMYIRNNTLGERVMLSSMYGRYIIDEIDWDAPEVTINDYRIPFQVGTTFDSLIVGSREPVITGYVVANLGNETSLGLTWSEYYEKQKKQIEKYKGLLSKVVNPYHECLITIVADSNRYLTVRPSAPVKFSSTYENNNEVLCKFKISLKALDPMFRKSQITESSAHVDNMFRFPMILTVSKKDEYVVFGNNVKRDYAGVTNDGDVPVGCDITIKAVGGSVGNPKILKVNTGEFIEFDGVQIDDGDSYLIRTTIGKEYAYTKTGTEGKLTNIVPYLVTGSTFLKVDVGEEIFQIKAGSGNKYMQMDVKFQPRYYNFEEM